MITYSQFRPTSLDTLGLGLPDRQEWLVAPVSTNRDADALTRSNWRQGLKAMGGEGEDLEIHRFGHWGPCWFEVALIRPGSEAAKVAESIEAALSDYPALNDEDFSAEEEAEANEVWASCYKPESRIEYIRKHRSQFEFRSFADMLGCVRGTYFAGYASELLS